VQEIAPPPDGMVWNVDFLVLGFASYILAGLFLLSSVGRGRPSYRVAAVFGTAARNLGVLRDAVQAKARGQAAALYFVGGSSLLAAAFLLPQPTETIVLWAGLGVELGIAIIFVTTLQRQVNLKLRHYLKTHLQDNPFAFEDNIGLTRDIGTLFGVPPKSEDTLEGYVAKVRKAIGLADAPSRLFRSSQRW
jgi:hypothetical protein